MTEILTGEFFWGIIIGLVLSVIGGWTLAHSTVQKQRENQRELIKRLCQDTAKNILRISEDFDEVKNRTKLIYQDYLTLMDVEIGVWARNREHMVLLPENDAEAVRKFFTDIALSRAEVLTKLEQFSQQYNQSQQFAAAGRGPEAQRLQTLSDGSLEEARAAADRLVSKAKLAEALLSKL